ncbi:MAG: formate/nitrite transporter family protein, partial [Agathobaculum sp.]|uniref:formate/nitrite transporter family protein n=1 Tax=Agathobaculum sp. TaxID=2048138 RepID=UPI003D8FC421
MSVKHSRLGVLLGSFLAGACIAVGGTVFLSVENKIIGASLFSIGLFYVVSYGLWLYTGRIGYLPERDGNYAINLLITLAGNFAGTFCVATLLRQTRAAASLIERAAALSETKMADSLLSIFILAIFCGVLMYVGVNGFAVFEHALGKYLSVYLAVSVFILCGFEHCVANMYYYSLA